MNYKTMPSWVLTYTSAMPLPKLISLPNPLALPAMERARRWWQMLAPHRQDRLAVLAPLAAVLLFFAAIVAALGYLRLEEMDREQQAVQRDVEYTQQRLRLRLLERQEQLMRIAREISNRELDVDEFRNRARSLLNQYPELQGLAWVVRHPKDRGGGRDDVAGGGELVKGCAALVVRRDLKERFGPELVVVVDLVDLLFQVCGLDPRERAGKPRVVIDDMAPKIKNVHRASPVGMPHQCYLCPILHG